MIQTEGFEATKRVDPNLVIKKKDSKEQEVQEGWVGHIIPFTLVQTTLLKEQSDELRSKEQRLSEIPSEFESIIDEMTEDEKDGNILNDDNNAFVAKEVTKKIKELKLDKSEDAKVLIDKLQKVEDLFTEEKEVKAQIKKLSAELEALTKSTIESLSDEDVYMLLEKKWIEGVVTNIAKLPESIIDSLVTKVTALASKYATTYFEVENKIAETEKELCAMIDELTGDEFDMKGLSEFKSLLLGD